jgi:hypothetical protein
MTHALKGPSTLRGSEHYNATLVQRQPGGGTYGDERQIALLALQAAGYTIEDALATIERADRHFKDKLGICDSTPTRIPGNRKK